jgi:hypothetical protein
MPRAGRQLDRERLGDHFDRLFRAAWALCGSREDAEDLVQETYARVLRKRRLLHGDDDLGYLLGGFPPWEFESPWAHLGAPLAERGFVTAGPHRGRARESARRARPS